MTGSVRVLRLKRTDNSTGYLLLNVSRPNHARPLDLKLVATEHEHLYHGRTHVAKLSSLKSDNFSGSDEDFHNILQFSLLQIIPEACSPEVLKGLETVAVVQDDAANITIRKNIGGITQRVASIRLVQDDEREEVSAFEWVDAAVATSDGLRQEIANLQSSLDAQRDKVDQLNAQLDELVKEKKAHEDQLFRKFAALLNAKKSKIRDQQRMMKGAILDPEAGMFKVEPEDTTTYHAVSSGKGKRKASQEADVDMSDVDANDDDDEPGQQDESPRQTDEEATDEEDDAPEADMSPGDDDDDDDDGDEHQEYPKGHGDAMHPREMPLREAAQSKAATASDAIDEEHDDDETDDEL